MADAYSYALLVELEENNVPRLKNKLVKYFQSKKSNGGDCEVQYENGSRTAVLRFRREEDQKNVLGKEAHQIILDKGVLKMTVRLLTDETTAQEAPSDKLNTKSDAAVNNKQSSTDERTPAAEVQTEVKGRDDDTAEEELKLAVLGKIPETMNQEYLEMLVENILKDSDYPSSSQSFTLEVIPDLSSAVVTFQSGKEMTNFVSRCPLNRTFTKKGLSVQPLEATEQVVVEDLQNFNEDLLRLYFENAGGFVEDVVLNEEEQSAIITFEDHKAVQKIMKKKHHIKQKEIRVYPFYKSLGTALYGKDGPSLKLPAAISEPIASAVWSYLNDHQAAAETIHTHLAKHFCKVDLSQSTVRLSPVSSLLQQKDAKAIIKEWRDTVKSAFAQALSKFKSLKLQPESEVWEESEEKIRQILQNENVVLLPDKASGVLSVVGLVADVNRLEQTLFEVVTKLVKKLQREKESVTQEIKVSQSIFHILCQDGLKDKLQLVYPELKLFFREDNPDLIVTGLNHETLTASKIIYDQILALKRQNLEIDDLVLDLLKDEQQEELTNALLVSNGINAAFEINANRVQLLAVSDKDLNHAEDHLVKLLVSKYIDVEDSNVLKKPEWQHLVSQLETANNKPCMRIRIRTTGQQVVVSGHKDSVTRVSSKVDEFLTQNAQVEETIVVKPNAVVEYIKKGDTSCLEQVKDKVVVSFKKEAVCLSGSRVDVAECKTLVDTMVSSLLFESLKVSLPGAKKSFQSKESIYVPSLFIDTGCVVQLVDESSGGKDSLVHRPVPKSVYQLQTADGVEIAVCKADLCSYPVDAVVNASNQDLKHNGGLAGALLKAAGPQLQDESDKLIKSMGQLKPGDCVITGAGQLFCKKVIHAVGPMFNQAVSQKSRAQLKRAVKGSLDLAERYGCVSVALPAISRNQGFPLDLCASTIIKAVKEHCDDKYDDHTVKKIHFVNNDDSAVQAMEAAVRKEFGNGGVSHSQQTLPDKSITSLPVTHAVSDPNCLGQVQTKEGLVITLIKGNIEDATTEVTVNTVFEDLDLNKGAVSNAILRAAGPKLQQLVKIQDEGRKANLGEVIVTEGCQLKSKQVFHAVSPHWDNAQGTAEKTLRGIFKDCLGKAEGSGLTSISFPAIGTGNLGFPKDLVASMMLDEILSFSSKKQPKHLKKAVIILYSGDAQTIQVFSDEFGKKFPNVSVPTGSPQSTGPFSKVVSSSGMYETKMGSVAIQVLTGDITKETTDVIINSSNEKFSLKSGVSKAILDAAGQDVETECQTLGAQPNPGMIMTKPGNLKCKQILHLTGQNDLVKIKNVVKEALQMCMKTSHTSVSFPAIGTGQGNAKARQVADAMLDAVIDVLSQNTSSTLNTIRIVIFQPPMLKEFYNSMQQREAGDPKDKSSSWGSMIVKGLKSLFHASPDKPKKDEDFVIETVKVVPACFHICGDTQAKVDDAKKWINNLVSSEQDSTSISDSALLSFSNADRQRIVDIQKNLSVSIRADSKKTPPSITIEGLNTDMLKAKIEINEMLRQVKDEEELKRNVDLAGKVAQWQYQQQGSQFQSCNPKTNFELEQALQKNLQKIKVTIQGQDYTVHMPDGPATDNQGRTLEIKRIDKLKAKEEFPGTWAAMPASTLSKAFVVQAGTSEYTEVEKLFKATCGKTITQIERIQNPALWKSLEIKKRDMEVRNSHNNNERRLFHGTCEDTVAHITELGFNRSYAGKNATVYGRGTYFALNASYSASDTYSRPDQKGEKRMYLCRVLTGDYTTGNQTMVVPPSKGAASVQKYDSVVDNMGSPTIFVIFHDSQAYPEYLITFK